MDDVITQEHILTMLYRQRDLNFVPGAEHLYSNSGYALLADLVSRFAGTLFSEFCQREIFDRISTSTTHVHDVHQRIVLNRAYSYDDVDNVYEIRVLSFANCGTTSLFTSVEDLATWMIHLQEQRASGDPALKRLTEREALNDEVENAYGFGLTAREWRGSDAIQHSGSDAGFRSHLLMIPEHGFGVAVLCSVPCGPQRLAFEVADHCLADHLDPAEEEKSNNQGHQSETQPDPLAEDVMSQYLGEYESQELQTRYWLLMKGGHLRVRHQRHRDMEMTCLGIDRFKGSQRFLNAIRFTRNNGQIDGFLADGGDRVRSLRFEKVEGRRENTTGEHA